MPLRVVAGPGCDAVSQKMSYVEDELQPGDVVISASVRFSRRSRRPLTYPARITPALRMALGLRSVAIRSAREKELSGFVLTSQRPTRGALDRLVEETGRGAVSRCMKMTEAQACARVAALVPKGERRAACEEGIKRRWFARYQPSPTDREVEP